MTGELSGKSPAPESSSEGGNDCLNLLKKLGRDEILDLLSQGFCNHCHTLLESRVHTLVTKKVSEVSRPNNDIEGSESWSRRSHKQESNPWSFPRTPESTYSSRQRGFPTNYSPELVNNKRSSENSKFEILLNDGLIRIPSSVDNGLRLSEEQKENIRLLQVGRRKDFVHIERIDGKPTNVLKGLELHTQVFNTEEQKEIVELVYDLRKMGQKGQLRERTYTEPRKWMRGKGRVTIQFGCCYNYAVDKKGNPPGIIRDEDVDPLPNLFKKMIKRMVRWNILPPTCIPNSCIVNIYEQGDCIPPHIDHHDFVRPFCTVSFLTECNILFGSNLKIVGPGEFSGPVSIPLPIGSVLILSGNGADIAKHCVPGVPAKRISITFRKMDDSKLPYRFRFDPELRGIKPLTESSTQHDGHQKPLVSTPLAVQQNEHQDDKVARDEHDGHQKPLVSTPSVVQQNEHQEDKVARDESDIVKKMSSKSFLDEKDDFPPLGNSSAMNRFSNSKARSKQRIL